MDYTHTSHKETQHSVGYVNQFMNELAYDGDQVKLLHILPYCKSAIFGGPSNAVPKALMRSNELPEKAVKNLLAR